MIFGRYRPKPGEIIVYRFMFNPQWGYRPLYKMRPCVVYQAAQKDKRYIVYLMPISHMPPHKGEEHNYIFLDKKIRKAAGLDDVDQWLCCCQVNKFVWYDENVKDPDGNARLRQMPKIVMTTAVSMFLPLVETKPIKAWVYDMATLPSGN